MKRTFSFSPARDGMLLAAGTSFIAMTYGLIRMAYGLFLPDVQAELSFSAAAAGLISSGASLSYCMGALIGLRAGAAHPRRLVIGAALCAGIGSAGMAAAMQPGVFAPFAILSSTGAGLASPALVSIIGRNVERRDNNRAQSIVNAGTGPGLIVAGVLALVLLPNWRLPWFVVAGFTIIIAALVLRLDRAGTHRSVDENRLPPKSWFGAHGHIIAAALLVGAGSAAVWTFGRAHLVESGASEPVSIGAWIALGIGGTAVIATAGWMSHFRPPGAWALSASVVAGATVMLGMAPGFTALALLACVAFGWGYTAATGALIAWTQERDFDRAATGTSLLFVALVLGQALGATAAGAVAAVWGLAAAFVLAAVVTGAAVAVPHRHKTLTAVP
ncbi:MFS transporter [Pseudarthrobacter sp. NS4]|uniref:MFS transporter n=1 Tax=Pseudarthrobacter sp. NS4 TaxID=2973976 RepID=UPI0021631599|nr:MFS transporter [Pseudarthrobacter sp. NS4]